MSLKPRRSVQARQVVELGEGDIQWRDVQDMAKQGKRQQFNVRLNPPEP